MAAATNLLLFMPTFLFTMLWDPVLVSTAHKMAPASGCTSARRCCCWWQGKRMDVSMSYELREMAKRGELPITLAGRSAAQLGLQLLCVKL